MAKEKWFEPHLWLKLTLILIGFRLSIYAEILRSRKNKEFENIKHLEDENETEYKIRRDHINYEYGSIISQYTIIAIFAIYISTIISSFVEFYFFYKKKN